MTQPRHHLPQHTLVEYVSGASDQAVSLVVACHLTLCAACQAAVQELDEVGGAVLSAATPGDLPPDALARTLARLDRQDGPDTPAPVGPGDATCSPRLALPRPLVRYLGPQASWRWKLVVPGIREIVIAAVSSGAKTRLVRLQPGVEIPLHGHEGPEYVLVFTGALEDAGERFARGDVAWRDSGEQHVQTVAAGETCVALVVNQGDLVPLTLKGRIVRLLGRA